MITVRKATYTLWSARIELDVQRAPGSDALDKIREARSLTAAAFKVAAALEEICAEEGIDYLWVATEHARAGVITVKLDEAYLDAEDIERLLIEACTKAGLAPAGAWSQVVSK